MDGVDKCDVESLLDKHIIITDVYAYEIKILASSCCNPNYISGNIFISCMYL
jgi:hypothetical protein